MWLRSPCRAVPYYSVGFRSGKWVGVAAGVTEPLRTGGLHVLQRDL